MEKKGEPLNQLAIICDLIEKLNIETDVKSIVFKLKNDEFKKMFNIVQKKYDKKIVHPKDAFKITIGLVEILFSLI